MPESYKEPTFIGKVISILGKGVVENFGSKGSELVEGSTSRWIFLDGGPSSSSNSGISSNKSSKMSQRLEVFVPTKEAMKHPQLLSLEVLPYF